MWFDFDSESKESLDLKFHNIQWISVRSDGGIFQETHSSSLLSLSTKMWMHCFISYPDPVAFSI